MMFLYETIAVCYIEHNIRRFIEQTVLGFITLADFLRTIGLLFSR